MVQRNEYKIELMINDKHVHRLIIDQHYKENHSEAMTDELIIDLVKSINGETFQVDKETELYQYFVAEPIFQEDRPYRLVLLLCLYDDYLGVINAFRVDRKD